MNAIDDEELVERIRQAYSTERFAVPARHFERGRRRVRRWRWAAAGLVASAAAAVGLFALALPSDRPGQGAGAGCGQSAALLTASNIRLYADAAGIRVCDAAGSSSSVDNAPGSYVVGAGYLAGRLPFGAESVEAFAADLAIVPRTSSGEYFLVTGRPAQLRLTGPNYSSVVVLGPESTGSVSASSAEAKCEADIVALGKGDLPFDHVQVTVGTRHVFLYADQRVLYTCTDSSAVGWSPPDGTPLRSGKLEPHSWGGDERFAFAGGITPPGARDAFVTLPSGRKLPAASVNGLFLAAWEGEAAQPTRVEVVVDGSPTAWGP